MGSRAASVSEASRSPAAIACIGDGQDLPIATGLECVLLIDGAFASPFRFRDEPRKHTRKFIRHLQPLHGAPRVMLLSGDRESEVRYLAEIAGISEVHYGKSPEEKVAIVEYETRRNPTLFVGDGINDAPAMLTATVGVAFGRASDVTAEAASAVVLESSLEKNRRIDSHRPADASDRTAACGWRDGAECFRHDRRGAGYLPPIGGVIGQELIDVVAVLNALCVAITNEPLTDLES
jgi:cation transport ATPase